MGQFHRISCMTFIGLWLANGVLAQPKPEILDFKQALQLAYNQNPRLLEARQAIAASKGSLTTANSLGNPEIELELGDSRSFEIRQPFGPPGAGFLHRKIASNSVKIQQESFKSAWAAVYLELRDAYFQSILHKKELELAQANLQAMRQFFSQVQLKYQTGQAFKNDFQRAKIELLKAENDNLSAQKELKVHKAKLNLTLGRSMETEFDVQENLREEQLTVTFEKLKETMFSQQPHIKMAELELDSKQKNVTREQLSRLPSSYVGFKREDREDEDDSSFLVGIQIPFWGLNQGEVKKAQAERQIQQVKTEAIKNQALFGLYEAYLNAELHHKQLRLHKTSLEESNELLRLANLRYSEGRIDFLNYLDQVKAVTQSKVNYYHALFNLSQSISTLETLAYSSLRQEDFLNEKF